MNRLQTELQRLYLVEGAATHAEAPGFTDAAGWVRALVLELARPADWSPLALLWHGVQDDLEMPAPAIAVNGVDGFQLWFSMAEPVAASEARLFLDGLRRRYLGAIVPARITLQPTLESLPVLKNASGQWSAYIARDLAAVCADEPWLDLCPSPEAQADVLSRLKSIKLADFRTALNLLGPAEDKPLSSPASVRTDHRPAAEMSAESRRDPKQFLLEVLGDAKLDMHLRIEAARALLPYFDKPGGD